MQDIDLIAKIDQLSVWPLSSEPYSRAFGFKNLLYKYFQKYDEFNYIKDTFYFKKTVYLSSKNINSITAHFLEDDMVNNIVSLSNMFLSCWEVALFSELKDYHLYLLGYSQPEINKIIKMSRYSQSGGMLLFLSDLFKVSKKFLINGSIFKKELILGGFENNKHSSETEVKKENNIEVKDIAVLFFVLIVYFSSITRLDELKLDKKTPIASYKLETNKKISDSELPSMLLIKNNIGIDYRMYEYVKNLSSLISKDIYKFINSDTDNREINIFNMSSQIINIQSLGINRYDIEYTEDEKQSIVEYSKRVSMLLNNSKLILIY